MKKTNKKGSFLAFLLCLVAGLLSVVIALFLLFQIQLGAVDSKKNGRTERFEIPSGSGIKAVASSLAAKNLIKSEGAFYFAARFPFLIFMEKPPVLKSGVYSVSSSMNVR